MSDFQTGMLVGALVAVAICIVMGVIVSKS